MQRTRKDLANLKPHYPDMINEVIDLTDQARNVIFNMTNEEAVDRVASGDIDSIQKIQGHFAIMARSQHIIRMARTLQMPLRYFIVKKTAGPALLLAERIDEIRNWLEENGFGDQFHPSYTRMVPAHHLTEIALVGCPDPNPVCTRFFDPKHNSQSQNVQEIGASSTNSGCKRTFGRDIHLHGGACFFVPCRVTALPIMGCGRNRHDKRSGS